MNLFHFVQQQLTSFPGRFVATNRNRLLRAANKGDLLAVTYAIPGASKFSWNNPPKSHHHKETDSDGSTYYYNEDNRYHRLDGPAVEYSDGSKAYFVDDKRHRLDGPAIEWSDGYKAYYVDGKRHRLDGPAIERSNGYKEYWVDDKLHRLDGPAIEHSDGYKAYYVDDKRHRLDGPAVEHSDGYKVYYVNGKRHRLDGPAVECGDGSKAYFVNDKQLTEEEFNLEYGGKNLSPRLQLALHYSQQNSETLWRMVASLEEPSRTTAHVLAVALQNLEEQTLKYINTVTPGVLVPGDWVNSSTG